MKTACIDDPDLALVEIMRIWPQTVPVFQAHRMLCVGCLIGPFHTIEDACLEYGLDRLVFLKELRAAVRDARQPGREPPADADW